MKPEVLIIGCGFLGEAAADLFSARGKRVLGLVRSEESLSALSGRNFEAATCDVTDDSSVEALTPRLHEIPLAVYCVSSGRGGAEDYAAVYRDGLGRVLEAWNPGRVIFVSSTSVYAQNNGEWVTEQSPALPDRDTAKILLEAEQIALGKGGIVARLSGIYGPGRSALLRMFLSGEAVLEEGGNRWINQIHRDDGASAIVHLGDHGEPGGIYNVTDDTPVTQREVYGWMADALNRPLPPEGPLNMNRKRGVTSKRISNSRMKTTGWMPRFPSYRDALPLLLSEIRKTPSE